MSDAWNWRSKVLKAAFRMTNPEVLRELDVIHTVEKSPAKLQSVHEDRLERLLHHAWSHTDYYREILEECGAVRGGRVNLDRFTDIPFLTKDIMRRQGKRLLAKSMPRGRAAHENFSGGSTGQPVRFMQDNVYWDVTIATRLYQFETVGKQLGEREMKIWGSERDFLKGTLGWKAAIQNFLYNRKFEQCWLLTDERIKRIVQDVNEWQPRLLWCYRDGIDRVARFINEHSIEMHSPSAVVLGGATVYPFMADAVQRAFKAPVISAYGSREVGAVACQCLHRGGHHIASQAHVVEAIGADSRPVLDADGELAITPLVNFAMPFIRYRIGDQGRLTRRVCSCGRAFPLLDALSGRVVEVLYNLKGDQIDPIFFIWIFAEKANANRIIKGQIVQELDGSITVNCVLRNDLNAELVKPDIAEIRAALALTMGQDCPVKFNFVDDIPLTASGKYPYIVSRKNLAADAG